MSPNFTNSFGLIVSDDVKIITPCSFFSPTHAFSVLNDSKLNPSPNQTLKVLISLFELFVAVIIAVSSNPLLTTLISSACASDGIRIYDIENNNRIEREIPLIEDLFI